MSTIERDLVATLDTTAMLTTPAVGRTIPDIEIREVRSRADLNRFIDLPWSVYKNDPSWVPPLRLEVKDFLNRKKHPFLSPWDWPRSFWR